MYYFAELNRFVEREQAYHQGRIRVPGFLKSSVLSLSLTCTLAAPIIMLAQQPQAAVTADEDHQNMMDQLGIKSLRPGPSGDEKAPNHANYDESTANPFPNL